MNITSLQIGDNILNTETKTNVAVSLESTSNKSVGTYTFDLSKILPNDGYVYEIYLSQYACGDSRADIFYRTDIQGEIRACELLTNMTNFFIMEVGKERKLYQYIRMYNVPYIALRITEYRRIRKYGE
jgi:hypothetical protein